MGNALLFLSFLSTSLFTFTAQADNQQTNNQDAQVGKKTNESAIILTEQQKNQCA